MARFKLVLAFFALMILTSGVVVAAYYLQKFVEPEKRVTEKVEDKRPDAKPDLGRKHYDRAIGFIGEGELISARNELQYLIDIYPESPTCPEAKRVLGEVSLDLMFSKIPMERKSEYQVKSGDAWSVIASRNNTTYDYIMRANGKTNTVIVKAETLTIYNLDCEATINLKDNTLTVTEGERFIKEYKILDKNLPGHFPTAIESTIKEKVAWHAGKSVNFMSDHYLQSHKWIRTSRMGLFIREHLSEEGVEGGETKPYGISVAKADMEELFSILRSGAAVKVETPN